MFILKNVFSKKGRQLGKKHKNKYKKKSNNYNKYNNSYYNYTVKTDQINQVAYKVFGSLYYVPESN